MAGKKRRGTEYGNVRILTTQDVLDIHDVLARDFADVEDPISPAGIRSLAMIESAVFRQETGQGLKYPTPSDNAAALAYGLCKNHGFHNGNKRTSLVAMLCHLDRNDFTISEDVPHADLYDFMLHVAANTGDADATVYEMGRWIRKRVRKVSRGERLVTCRELRSILAGHGFHFDEMAGNFVDIVRFESRQTWLGLRKTTEKVRVFRLGYPGDGAIVSRQQLKDLRQACSLTEADGVDSEAFYASLRPADFFVKTYRGTLRRLARI